MSRDCYSFFVAVLLHQMVLANSRLMVEVIEMKYFRTLLQISYRERNTNDATLVGGLMGPLESLFE